MKLNLTEFADRDGQAPKTVWLVCCPCTGSTWFTRMLHATFRWHLIWPLRTPFWRQEQEVRATKELQKCQGHVFLPHTHTKWNELTKDFVKNWNVRPIILFRDIFDQTVSIVDHLTKFDQGLSIAYTPKTFPSLTEEQKIDIVIRLHLPWCINFYASWAYAEHERGIKPLHVDYADLLRNPIPELMRALTYMGETRTIGVLNEAVAYGDDKQVTRYNHGVMGRGHKLLTVAQKAAIMALLTVHVDPVIRDYLTFLTPSKYEKKESTPSHPDDARGSKGLSESTRKGRSKRTPATHNT